MRHLLPAFSRRSTALTAAVLSLVVCALGLLAGTACAASVDEGPLVPFIVGGQESSISQYPWQVFVYLPSEKIECGGSILNPTTILTAAYCVDHPGTTTT